MAQESPSPTLFFGTTSTENNMELMENSQHNHHLVDPMIESNESEVSYPNADYAIRVSPTTLLNGERHFCEVCNKGFPRDQNLVLHQRAHKIPFNLKKKKLKDTVTRKVYLCPEPTCIRYNRSHALGDFGGLRKHYLRKHHTQKDYKCNNCCKAYSVETDLKAHLEICGNRKNNCHCATCLSRKYGKAPEQAGAAKCSQTLKIGDSSINNSNNNNGMSSILSSLPMLGMGDNSTGFNINENNYNYNYNQSNYYHSIPPSQYQLSQFGEDKSGVMTNPSMDLNMRNNHPAFFGTSSSTHPNQHEYHMKTDMDLYADLLRGNIPIEIVNHQNVNMMGHRDTGYATGEGNMYDPSSSLNMTPAMRNTNENGMLYPESGTGSGDAGSYENGSYYGYNYGDGNEVYNFETPATTAGDAAPPEPHLNENGFWF